MTNRLMNPSAAIALLLTGLAFPACAQHGGGGHGGSGGHAGGTHASPAFHAGPTSGSGFSSAARSPSFAGTRPAVTPSLAFRRRTTVHYGAQPLNYGAQGSLRTGTDRRSPYRSPYRHRDREGVVYGYPGFSPYYLGYPYGLGYYGDDGFDEDYDSPADDASGAPNYGSDQYNGFDPQGQGAAQNQDQDQYSDPSQGTAQPEPGVLYRPHYGPSPQTVSHVTVQPVVTLVFKDHRANQQIRNYLINGDTLTVWDQTPHAIALDQLDLVATEKLNREAGVDLSLPGAPR